VSSDAMDRVVREVAMRVGEHHKALSVSDGSPYITPDASLQWLEPNSYLK
jgi:hypothetical protein